MSKPMVTPHANGAPLPANEAERLAALDACAILDTEPEPQFDRLTRIAAKVFDAPIALVSLIDSERQWFKSNHGLDATETPRNLAFCAYAINDLPPLVVPDAALDSRFRDNPLVTGAPHIRFYAGAPLRTEDGHALGTLCVIDTTPRAQVEASKIEILADLADQVVREIQTRLDQFRSAEIEEALRVSEERFQLAVQGASVGIWDWVRVDGTTEVWSDRFYGLLGYAPGEIESDLATFSDLLHPDDRPAAFDLVQAHFRGEAKFETEYRMRHKSGEYRWFHGSGQASRDTSGKPIRMVGTIMDIQDRKMAEAKLQHLLRLTPDFVTSARPDTTLTFINEPYAKFLGAKADALIGRSFLDFVPEAERASVRAAIANITPDNPSTTIEQRMHTSDGAECWFLWTNLIVFEDGTATEIISIGRDITAQIHAQRTITEQAGAIKRQLNELELIIDNVPARIFYKDGRNRVLRLNRKAAESINLSVSEAEGFDAYDVFPEVARQYHDDDLEVIRSDIPKLGIIEEYKPVSADHGWLRTDKVPYADPETGEPRILVVSTDITELKQAELKLAEQGEALLQTNAELQQFANIASHDLKAPLRAIGHLANWIADDLADVISEESGKNLALLRGRVARMEAMLDGLLQYSLIGRAGVVPTAVDMGEIARDEFEFVRGDRPFTLACEGLPTLVTGEVPLRLVMRNLFANAIKHHDRPAGAIVVRASHAGDRHEISIADDGPGIARAFHQRIFGMFQCLKPRDEVEGSGLGLALISKQLQALGCAIRIESDPEQTRGAAFIFDWPKSWPDKFSRVDTDAGGRHGENTNSDAVEPMAAPRAAVR